MDDNLLVSSILLNSALDDLGRAMEMMAEDLKKAGLSGSAKKILRINRKTQLVKFHVAAILFPDTRQPNHGERP